MFTMKEMNPLKQFKFAFHSHLSKFDSIEKKAPLAQLNAYNKLSHH